MAEKPKQTLLLLALPESPNLALKAAFPENLLRWVGSNEEFESEFETYIDGNYFAVIVGQEWGQEKALEIGQILRNQCPQTPSYALAFEKSKWDPKLFKKNGFTDLLLWPIDKAVLLEHISSHLESLSSEVKSFKQVWVSDLTPQTVLPFDTFVFLPLNKKYVKFSKEGQVISEEKLKRFQQQSQSAIYLKSSDLGKFYVYTAETLKKLGADNKGPLTATEKQEKLSEAVRSLVTEVFDSSAAESFEQGSEMMSQCQKVIAQYITGGRSDSWYEDLTANLGGQVVEGYGHSVGVSVLSALLSMALKMGKPEDLALAGFLHDISLADFPEEKLNEDIATWSQPLQNTYKGHPLESVNTVKRKRMVLTPEVEMAILQHHERADGKGFPKGLVLERISIEAQILSLANQLQRWLGRSMGQKRYSLEEALEKISASQSISVELMTSVKNLLLKKAE